MIGDNLSSHSSMHVLECCEQNNIDFGLLPPNATHLVQPLHFCNNEEIMACHFNSMETKNRGCILKVDFPRLLNQAIENIGNLEKNGNSLFKACGIFPLNPDEVLKRLPPDQETERLKDKTTGTKTLKEFLNGSRLSETQEMRAKRGKKLKVAPGKGIKKKDLYPDSSTHNDKDIHLSIDESSENENKIDSPDEDSELENYTYKINLETVQDDFKTDFNITEFENINRGTFLLIRFNCPNNSYKHYVGHVTDVVDKTKKKI